MPLSPGLKTDVENDIFGLKWGQDLENQAAHPHQEFTGAPPPPRTLPCGPLATRVAASFFIALTFKKRILFIAFPPSTTIRREIRDCVNNFFAHYGV